MNSKENNNQEDLKLNDSNQESSSKNSSMIEIKNMFDINNNSNSNESNIFHNSVKIFKKQNLGTNTESSLPRTKSNKHIKEEINLVNNKNFISKANFYKGNANNNSNLFDPPKSSPIVQYFTGLKLQNPESSPVSQCFDFSPSLIFNKEKFGPEIKSIFRKSMESINLNSQSEDKNFNENYYTYDSNKYDISYNEEIETNYKKEDEKTLNENENAEIDNKLNKNENEGKNQENIEVKGNELNNKNEECDINNNRPFPIQDAMKKLRNKKNKNSTNSEEEEKEIIINQMNIKENIPDKNDKKEEITKNLENEENIITNVLNKLDEEEFSLDVKNKNIKNITDNIGNEIEQQKINSENQTSNNNDDLIYNGLNKYNNNIFKNKMQHNKYNNNESNNINNFSKFNNINEKSQNNPNLINNNLINNINNNLYNNNNNAYIQYNYMMNNINQNPNMNLMMMNYRPNPINNNTLNNNYFPYNNMVNNNNFNNYNYNLSQIMNNNMLPIFNNNNNNFNFDPQKYNQILQNAGNINIQNNYFLYNNNQENKNDKNIINSKEDKKKKQKKRKIKKLEQDSYINKPLNYYIDNFVYIAKDQGASRHLQNIIDNFHPQAINAFFEPLCKNIMELINDPFANYLIQKIICYFTQEQLLNLLNILTPHFFQISCDNHGTRVLQKLIDLTKTSELRELFYNLIKPKVFELLKDLNGTYIVQKFVRLNLVDEYGLKINSLIIENSVELCKHRHGCCVIQKYLETKDPYMLPDLVYKLLNGFSSLITDQFGNYVIKTILVMGNPEYSNKIGEEIFNNIIFYSKHKYSSNIVEKCFDFCQGVYLTKLSGKIQQEQNLKELILDEHGNYVVQKVLAISNMKKKKEMLNIIKALFPKLKKTHFGEKIIQRISATYHYIYNL